MIRRPAVIALALAAVTFAVYSPTFLDHFEFINSDDTDYVTNNPHVQSGLNLDSIEWAFGSLFSFNWHPLTWISLELDADIWGWQDSNGFHFTNVLLHTVNAVLLFYLLRRMTRADWCSAAVAALFALHPTHVESVAWVAERKDVLSTLFWLLTTLAYVRYTEGPDWVRYLLVAGMLALGLMAKPMLVTLPATLLLLDYWPLRRWTPDQGFARLRELVIEKVPLFAIVALTIPLTMIAQSRARIELTIGERVGNMLVSYVRYLGMFFWPADLAAFYPYPRDGYPLWQPAGAAVLLLAVTAVVVWQWRRRPYLAVGWFWFLGTMVPVIGIVKVGLHAVADRYTYVPYIGLGIMLAWAAAELVARQQSLRAPVAVLGAIAFAAFTFVTYQQIGYWRNSETIWSRTVAVTSDNPLAHDFLGQELVRLGRWKEGRDHLRESIRGGLASTWTWGNLGVALDELGDYEHAATVLEQTVQMDPNSVKARVRLARVYERQKRLDDARREFGTAVELSPSDPELRMDLGRVLERLDRPDEAIKQYDIVLKEHPDSAPAYYRMGLALEAQGKFKEAAASCQKAVRLVPHDFVYRCSLGHALAELGQGEAAAQFREASRLKPDWTAGYLEGAWELATHSDELRRDGKSAVRLARQVCQATNFRQPQPLDVLAAAHAELQQFDDAVKWERRALELLPAKSPEAKEVAERLRLYEARKEYRQPATK